MKLNTLLLSSFLLLFSLSFSACSKSDDEPEEEELNYEIEVMAPTLGDRQVGETIPIDVNIREANGGIVHFVTIRIYDSTTLGEIYNEPEFQHVHESKSYSFQDNFTLDVEAGTEWVFEVKVWGHGNERGEKSFTQTFTVN